MPPQVLPKIPKAISKLSGFRFAMKNCPPSARHIIILAIKVVLIRNGKLFLATKILIGMDAQASNRYPKGINGMAVRKLK